MSAVHGGTEGAPEAQRLLAPRFSVGKPIPSKGRSPVGTALRVSGHDFKACPERSRTGAGQPHFSIGALAPAASPLAVILLGPTGSGKTVLSLALGERFGGEIVSCDSVAVYRGMELGTAKPTREERARVPHHLIDVAEPDEPFTAGEYSKLARKALQEIVARERLPIVTGGRDFICAR